MRIGAENVIERGLTRPELLGPLLFLWVGVDRKDSLAVFGFGTLEDG